MKTGRPKKKEKDYKGIVKNIRYSEEEWAKVQKKLTETGLSYSEYMRHITIERKIYVINFQTLKELIEIQNTLAKIGNDINIIAKNSKNTELLPKILLCRENVKDLSEEIQNFIYNLKKYDNNILYRKKLLRNIKNSFKI